MSMESYVFKILSIYPYRLTEKGGDEIFFKFNKRRVWPIKERYKMILNEPIKINHSISIDRKLGSLIELELWEYDNFIFSRCIGKFRLYVDGVGGVGGPYMCDLTEFSQSGAKYSITWELVKLNATS
jgi:hypothetical protein